MAQRWMTFRRVKLHLLGTASRPVPDSFEGNPSPSPIKEYPVSKFGREHSVWAIALNGVDKMMVPSHRIISAGLAIVAGLTPAGCAVEMRHETAPVSPTPAMPASSSTALDEPEEVPLGPPFPLAWRLLWVRVSVAHALDASEPRKQKIGAELAADLIRDLRAQLASGVDLIPFTEEEGESALRELLELEAELKKSVAERESGATPVRDGGRL
jgi:hypothetical protein